MVLANDLRKEVDKFLENGNQMRFRYFIQSYSVDEYDNPSLVSGTDAWCSGLIFPISNNKGSSDSVFLQQGIINIGDRKIYVSGSVNTSGIFRIGVGSPIVSEYEATKEGAVGYETNGVIVYKCIYVKLLNAGSFVGE